MSSDTCLNEHRENERWRIGADFTAAGDDESSIRLWLWPLLKRYSADMLCCFTGAAPPERPAESTRVLTDRHGLGVEASMPAMVPLRYFTGATGIPPGDARHGLGVVIIFTCGDGVRPFSDVAFVRPFAVGVRRFGVTAGGSDFL